ncbi:glycosyltransferase family 4 protein, partial [Candidatus Woesearchaeota archaeon]|nr:glycosyltransferase family 4 protein [Candidatus Woesearchaeota archaeon]
MLEKMVFMCLYPPELDGSGYSNAEFTQGLSKKGYDIEVVAQPCKGDEKYDLWSEETHDIKIHRVPIKLEHEANPPSKQQLDSVGNFIHELLLGKKLNNESPDLVILGHDSWAWYQPLVHQFGMPVIQHLRGTPTRAITKGIYPPKETKKYLECVLGADYIVPLAHHFEELMVNQGYPKEKMTTVHNGVDTSLFYPKNGKGNNSKLQQELNIPKNCKVIVHASNHYPVKRVEDIVASADSVLQQQKDVIYLIIGEGPESESIKDAVESSDYKSHFRLTGKVPQEEIADYLRLGEIFILSSESEGFARATIEAQACGLYLIMSDMPAGLERTGNGIMGTNYKMGDQYDLAAKTLDVLNMDSERRISICSRGLNFAQAE